MARLLATAGDKLEVASSTDFDLGLFSVHFHMKTAQAQNFILLHARHDSTSSLNGFTLFIDDTAGSPLRVQYKNGDTSLDITGTTGIRDGNYHSVGLVARQANGATSRLYVDGSEEANGTNSEAWAFNSQVLRWGIALDSFWTRMEGELAEITWWDVELSVSEWRALGNRVNPRRIRRQSQVADWDIRGNSPERDLTGSTHDVIVTGTTIADHPPISPPFGFDLGWQGAFTVAAGGLSIPVAMHNYYRQRQWAGA